MKLYKIYILLSSSLLYIQYSGSALVKERCWICPDGIFDTRSYDTKDCCNSACSVDCTVDEVPGACLIDGKCNTKPIAVAPVAVAGTAALTMANTNLITAVPTGVTPVGADVVTATPVAAAPGVVPAATPRVIATPTVTAPTIATHGTAVPAGQSQQVVTTTTTVTRSSEPEATSGIISGTPAQ